MLEEYLDINKYTDSELNYLSTRVSKDVSNNLEKQRLERVKFYMVSGFLRLSHNIRGDQPLDKDVKFDGFFDKFLMSQLDTSTWKAPKSLHETVFTPTSKFSYHSCLPNRYQHLTPYERLKRSWLTSEETEKFNKKYTLMTTGLFGLSGGLIFGSQHALSHLDQYVKKSETTAFATRGQAYRERSNIFARSLFVYGYRWGWRISFIVGSFLAITQSLETYRLQNSFWHYPLGISVPYALYNWTRGPVAMVSMGASAALLVGVPAGALMGWLDQNARSLLYSSFAVPFAESEGNPGNWDEAKVSENKEDFGKLLESLNSAKNSNDALLRDN